MDCTYAEMRRDSAVLAAVENSLLHEQGGICAYTDTEDVDHGMSAQLMPFCFAIQPALERKIKMLESIRQPDN